jgi:hypothetical protein
MLFRHPLSDVHSKCSITNRVASKADKNKLPLNTKYILVNILNAGEMTIINFAKYLVSKIARIARDSEPAVRHLYDAFKV